MQDTRNVVTTRIETQLLSAFPVPEYVGRLRRAREVLREAGFDAAVCVSPETIFYLCGYEGYTYWTAQALVFSTTGDEAPTLILRDTDSGLAEETAALGAVRTYRFGSQDPAVMVTEEVEHRGAATGRIGIELQTGALTPALLQAIATAIGPTGALEDCSRLLSRLRVRKSPAELEYVRAAAAAARAGMAAGVRAAVPGTTEIELAAAIESALRGATSEYSAMPTMLGSGERTLSPHATPTGRVIQRGDPVMFYFAGVTRRYHVTAYRTVHVGPAPAAFRDLYAAAEDALAVLRDGVLIDRPVAQAAAMAAATLRSSGHDRYQIARWGYGVGVSYPPVWLEAFDVMEESDDVFERDTLMCLHVCFVARELGFGLMVGADYLLSDAGLECLDDIGPGLVETG